MVGMALNMALRHRVSADALGQVSTASANCAGHPARQQSLLAHGGRSRSGSTRNALRPTNRLGPFPTSPGSPAWMNALTSHNDGRGGNFVLVSG
jgi:hypothetical protein